MKAFHLALRQSTTTPSIMSRWASFFWIIINKVNRIQHGFPHPEDDHVEGAALVELPSVDVDGVDHRERVGSAHNIANLERYHHVNVTFQDDNVIIMIS